MIEQHCATCALLHVPFTLFVFPVSSCGQVTGIVKLHPGSDTATYRNYYKQPPASRASIWPAADPLSDAHIYCGNIPDSPSFVNEKIEKIFTNGGYTVVGSPFVSEISRSLDARYGFTRGCCVELSSKAEAESAVRKLNVYVRFNRDVYVPDLDDHYDHDSDELPDFDDHYDYDSDELAEYDSMRGLSQAIKIERVIKYR